MVLGNLLGGGDPDFAKKVKIPLDPRLVMYGGLQNMLPQEKEIADQYNIQTVKPDELIRSTQSVLKWISDNEIRHLAIHLDLDVLDPKYFRGQLPAKPEGISFETHKGHMTFSQILTVIQDVSAQTNIVGLSIAEYLPWDAINLHNFLSSIPIFK